MISSFTHSTKRINSMIVPTIIISLLSTTLCCQQYADGVHLINRLNRFFHFDHNIFFIGYSIDLSCLFPMSTFGVKLDNYTPQTVYTSDGNITEHAALESKITKNPLIVFVTGGSKFEKNSQFWAQVKGIRQVDINVKIGVFLTRNITSLTIVEEIFRWSWSVGIMNIFCAFHLKFNDGGLSFNVFKYDPFGTFNLINVTRSESIRDYFPDKVPNYRKNRLGGIAVYGGPFDYDTNFWDAVIFAFNASRSGTAEEPFGNPRVSPGGNIVHYDLPRSWIQRFVYPHRQLMTALVVPHAQPHSDFVVYLQNTTWTRLFVYTFLVIVSSSFLLIVSGYLQKKKFLLFQSVTDVVNLLTNDNAGIRYGNLHHADVFVIVPLTFTGLIVMNGIVSLFQSYLTSPIYQPQINTLKDLYMSSVPILTEYSFKRAEVELLESRTKYGGWSAKFQVIDEKKMIEEKNKFNNSIAFFELDFDALAKLEVQKRLGLEAYHLSGTFFSKFLVSYIVDLEFPFTDPIKDTVHRLTGAGLIDKWYKEEQEDQIKYLWNKFRQLQMRNELNKNEFVVPTVVWCGWVASTIVFISEIIWKKVNLDKSKRVMHRYKVKRLRKGFQPEAREAPLEV